MIIAMVHTGCGTEDHFLDDEDKSLEKINFNEVEKAIADSNLQYEN